MKYEKVVYKVDAEKDEQPSTFDELKEIYLLASKMQPVTCQDLVEKEQTLEEIEKFIDPSVIRMWQEEAEADVELTKRWIHLCDMLDDAVVNEYPGVEVF